MKNQENSEVMASESFLEKCRPKLEKLEEIRLDKLRAFKRRIGSKQNHFEPADINTPATNEEGLLAMKREISQILSIVNKLSLYNPRKARQAATQAESGKEHV